MKEFNKFAVVTAIFFAIHGLICGANGVVFLTWLGKNISKDGFAIQSIVGSILGVLTPMLFMIPWVIKISKEKAMTLAWLVFIALTVLGILFVVNTNGYVLIVISTCVSVTIVGLYAYSKQALYNVTIVGDVRTKFNSQIAAVSALATAGGAAVATLLPAEQWLIGLLIILSAVNFIFTSCYQLPKLISWMNQKVVFGDK